MNGHAGGDQVGFTGLQDKGRIKAGAQVQSGRAGGGIVRQVMSPPRKPRFARFSPQGARKHLGRPGVFLESQPGIQNFYVDLHVFSAMV